MVLSPLTSLRQTDEELVEDAAEAAVRVGILAYV